MAVHRASADSPFRSGGRWRPSSPPPPPGNHPRRFRSRASRHRCRPESRSPHHSHLGTRVGLRAGCNIESNICVAVMIGIPRLLARRIGLLLQQAEPLRLASPRPGHRAPPSRRRTGAGSRRSGRSPRISRSWPGLQRSAVAVVADRLTESPPCPMGLRTKREATQSTPWLEAEGVRTQPDPCPSGHEPRAVHPES